MDQPRFERLLMMLKVMSGNTCLTLGEIAHRIGITERTVYRYLDTFKKAGFVVRNLYGSVYQLEKMPDEIPDLERLMYFTEEEAYLLNRALENVVPSNSLRKGLRDKLAAFYSCSDIASHVDCRSNSTKVDMLRRACGSKRQVILKNYESGNSGTIRDRIVEPFKFTSEFIDVIAFDTEDSTNKAFKINRIEEVVIKADAWRNERLHKLEDQDIFGMMGSPIDRIVLQLSVRAKNLLIEEYPLAEKYLTRQSSTWILDVNVNSYKGVGRFCAGLSDDVNVIESPQFRKYMYDLLLAACKSYCCQ